MLIRKSRLVRYYSCGMTHGVTRGTIFSLQFVVPDLEREYICRGNHLYHNNYHRRLVPICLLDRQHAGEFLSLSFWSM